MKQFQPQRFARFSARNFWFFAIGAFCLSGALSTNAGAEPQQESGQTAPPSFVNASLQKAGNSAVGFSFGVDSTYVSGQGPTLSQTELITSLNPRLFARFRKEQSSLQVNFGYGYRIYNRQGGTSESQSGTVDFERRLTRRATLRVMNTFNRANNDYSSLLDLNLVGAFQPGFDQRFDVQRQRVTQNLATVSLDYQTGVRHRFSVAGGHDTFRYSNFTDGNTQGFRVEFRNSLRINKWFAFDNGYSTYLNRSATLRGVDIHRLQVGGLEYHPRRDSGFGVTAGGGIETTRMPGGHRTTANIEASVSKRSRFTLLSLGYHRGFSNAAGNIGVIEGHTGSLSYLQWISPKINFRAQSTYSRAESLPGSPLKYVSANGQLGVAVQEHVLLTANYWYVSQRLSSVPAVFPSMHRYTASLGIEYYLSSLTGP